jgi:hypothetical protein
MWENITAVQLAKNSTMLTTRIAMNMEPTVAYQSYSALRALRFSAVRNRFKRGNFRRMRGSDTGTLLGKKRSTVRSEDEHALFLGIGTSFREALRTLPMDE